MELSPKLPPKMTKQELLETTIMLQESLEQTRKRLDREQQKTSGLKEEIARLRRENTSLRNQSRAESTGAAEEGRVETEDHLSTLLEKHRALEKQYGELLSEHNKLKNRLVENQERFDSLKAEFDRLLEVKKSLSDSNRHGYILVDHRYFIRFVSRGAAEKLGSGRLFEYVDEKVFKLFDFDNGMRVKKHIDRVLTEKESSRLKDTVCSACDDGPVPFQSELYATRFRDKPAVLFTFK